MSDSTPYNETEAASRTLFMRQEPEVVRARLAAGDYLHDAFWQEEATRWLSELDRVALPAIEMPAPTARGMDGILSWIAVSLVVICFVITGTALLLYGR